jgi:hypothetical protein
MLPHETEVLINPIEKKEAVVIRKLQSLAKEEIS